MYKKRGLRHMPIMPIDLALSITKCPEIINQEKEKALSNIEKEIKIISNMSLWEYLNHLKEKEENEESINSDSTLDEMIDEKLRLFEKLIKGDKGLKFKKGIKDGALSQKNRPL